MPINCMIQLCKITRASKLFQRNFYLPLLKPLSPKDALRKHVITQKNILGNKIEHYIPVLDDYVSKKARRRNPKAPKSVKKRQRKKEDHKYVQPLFDQDMENHMYFQSILKRKSKGKGQCYTYFMLDKDCTLVISHQMERAVREGEIMDIVMAQRSEKIVVKLKNGLRVTMPLIPYDGYSPFYRGEGYTVKEIDETHHHGRATMNMAKLFEALEQGVGEWELEMMRLAQKRKKKCKGEDTADWKDMMKGCLDNMDWNTFEEETKQILEEVNEPVEDDPIPMEVDDMEKTKNVNEKLNKAGEAVLTQLPVMLEVPEVIKILKDGEMTEVENVSGLRVNLQSGKSCFITGQMVKSDDGELFVPGQTVPSETSETGFEYTPGITVYMENEAQLLPGLIMGDKGPMFLPGESTITETGELQFAANEDDVIKRPSPPRERSESPIESDTEEPEEPPKPPPKRQPKEFNYEVPRRKVADSKAPKIKERGPRKVPPELLAPPPLPDTPKPVLIEAVVMDMTVPTFEKDILEQEKERIEKFNEKKGKEESVIDKMQRELRLKAKNMKFEKPKAYKPVEKAKKSNKLQEYEASIKSGEFFDVDHKAFLKNVMKENVLKGKLNWKDRLSYRTFDSVGLERHLVWRNVYDK